MHLLLINPNTTAGITGRMAEVARGMVRPGTRVTAVGGRFGARYVACRASYAVAGHAALDAYAANGGDADAVVLACFGDPALVALKEIAHQPVVGMAEASCLHAASLGPRFAIVTGGERWGPMLREFVASIGLAGHLAHVETVAPTGGEIARDPEGALATLAEACRTCAARHGAASVILGGAGLAGLASRIAADVPVPVIDSLEACLRLAETLAADRTGKPASRPSGSTPATETVGLTDELTRLFERR